MKENFVIMINLSLLKKIRSPIPEWVKRWSADLAAPASFKTKLAALSHTSSL